MQGRRKSPNRILRYTKDDRDIEADPRHVEFVTKQLGLTEDKGIGTAGVSGVDAGDLEEDTPLFGDDITRFRG